MVEYGEPLHIVILTCLLVIVVFLLGSMWGNISAEKEQKNAN